MFNGQGKYFRNKLLEFSLKISLLLMTYKFPGRTKHGMCFALKDIKEMSMS